MTNLATALIAALAAIAGGMVTGLFTLRVQRETKKAEDDRWIREAAERKRALLHDQRLKAYTDFLAQSSNAFGFQMNKKLERWRRSGNTPSVSTAIIQKMRRIEHPEFNEDAFRQMARCQGLVMMVSESPAVRDAADKMFRNVLTMLSIEDDDNKRGTKMMDVVTESGVLHDEFVEAARVELTS